ncbi:lysozyme inhibitor LprI family protein [Flavobacterium seoulense]|nr:lysozyme inhibitor LprI family protein [Flavobacterium seoulense]
MRKFIFLVSVCMFFSCSGLMAQTQMEMNAKAQKEYQKADAELNKVYQKLMKILSKEDKKLLITAQKDWLKFRDSHCKFESQQYDGGSIQPLIIATCLSQQTTKRVNDLKASLKERSSR